MSKLLLTSSVIVLAVTATPAVAQNVAQSASSAQTEDTSSELNAIVVTARLRQESLTEVPIAVSVATAEQLARDQIYTLSDLSRITPTLEVSASFGGNINGGAGIRGIRTQAFNPSVSPSVALVVDQAAAGNVTFPILHDVAQVEVLRGPQGTLFGQGASAGVVSVTTRAPKLGEVQANFNVDYADDGTAGSENTEIVMRGGLNVPLGTNAALRVAGFYRQEVGLRTNTFLNLDDNRREYAIRGRLRFEPTDRLTIDLIADYGKTIEDGVSFFSPTLAPRSTAPTDEPGVTLGQASLADLAACGVTRDRITPRGRFYCEDVQSEENSAALSLTAVIGYKLSDRLSVTSVSSYRDLRIDVFGRNFSTRAFGLSARNENLQENYDQFSQELRFAYEGNGFDVIFGGFLNQFSSAQTPLNPALPFGVTAPGQRVGFSVCTGDGGFCVVPVTFVSETSDNRTLAGFADVTVDLSEQIEAFGGLRITSYKNDSTYGLNSVTPSAFGNISESNLSGRIGFSYKPNSDLNIYTSYSRGYKPSALGFPGQPGAPFIPLNPEENSAFEIGAKGNLGGLQLAGNVFYMNVANFQGQESILVGGELISQIRNIGDIESYGFEVSAFGQLTERLSVNAGYQFNHAVYPEGFIGDDGSDLSREQLLSAPRHKFVLSADYVQPINDRTEAFFNTNIIYKSAIRLSNQDTNRFVFPAGETINLRLGVRNVDERWTASLFVRNLTQNREPASYLPITFGGQDDISARGRPVSGLTTRVVGASVGFDF
ncbi:TonB-dependent receptor [Novosphingobium sp. AAP83]|uniref:TonB-dependent receptor n=1 Tax=Novosphingobium sp. AAP83 TaxID=1523425 RepID=UPI0009EA89CB|nr:TonB-dependent receptor [Novosphingobium sp. AAP83]